MFETETFYKTSEGLSLYQTYRGFASARIFRDPFENLKNFLANS